MLRHLNRYDFEQGDERRKPDADETKVQSENHVNKPPNGD